MLMLTATQIRALRDFLELTITEFAYKLGVSANAATRWESTSKYARYPKRETMIKLNGLADEAKKRGFILPPADPQLVAG